MTLEYLRMPRQAERVTQHFDDILRYVGEFGLWQKFLYFSSCFLVIVSSAIQIASLVFATGTPKFNCVTPNVTCDENKCCDGCTSYKFQESFTSSVTEVRQFSLYLMLGCWRKLIDIIKKTTTTITKNFELSIRLKNITRKTGYSKHFGVGV